ncbi:MAG: hypothetical protein AAGL90_14265 [Pseudomonadota bacterium]
MKTTLLTCLISVAAGAAMAQPLPAPPTAIYTQTPQVSCAQETINLYFATGESALTPASYGLLEATKARLRGCILSHVALRASVADAVDPQASKRLGNARLSSVIAALEAHDLAGADLQTAPIPANAPSSVQWPTDRQVEVTFTAWAPEIS